MKVAFQGTRGAYSEEALYKYFGKDNIEPVGIDLSEDVFFALENGDVAAAILPVENSIAGNVDINMDLVYKHDFFAIGEVYLPINHCLLVTPGTKLKDIKVAHSHPVALAQCHDFFVENKIKPVGEYDTAGAAKLLKERGSKNEATIGSHLCKDYYGLEILSDSIQNVKNNITRFLVFVKTSDIPTSIGKAKTSIAFTTKHHPGALLGCLQEFAGKNINLTKLESRPIPEDPFKYIFYADFMGSINDEAIKQCLIDLRKDAEDIKVIGCYPAGKRPDLE
jgi:prephenate dehydratase